MNKPKQLLAIDPGPLYSGIALIDTQTMKPILVGKVENRKMLMNLELPQEKHELIVVIEMVSHYGTGMPAGESVFDTCVWIGRYLEYFYTRGISTDTIKRGDVKKNLCSNPTARDSNVIQALVDRFAKGIPNHGKGSKKQPGWFYGFAADAWQAYAVGVSYLDKEAPSEQV